MELYFGHFGIFLFLGYLATVYFGYTVVIRRRNNKLRKSLEGATPTERDDAEGKILKRNALYFASAAFLFLLAVYVNPFREHPSTASGKARFNNDWNEQLEERKESDREWTYEESLGTLREQSEEISEDIEKETNKGENQ